jgi:transcriptional regulator with XRE-family HTH domain
LYIYTFSWLDFQCLNTQGNSNPSLETLLAIKSKFKCSIDKFITDEEHLSRINDTFISEEELKMISSYKMLDEFDQKEIDEIIKLKIKMSKLRNK